MITIGWNAQALDQIIDIGRPLVRLAALIDWSILDDRFNSVCFKRARRQLKSLRTRLDRMIRDIRRWIDGDAGLEARFDRLLGLAQQMRSQDQHQRGPKAVALHAPEVECVGKDKARALRVRLQGQYRHPVASPTGGQFVLHAKALHGNPFDGHTLGPVIADMEKLTGFEARRIHVEKVIAATITRSGSGFGSRVRSATSRLSFVAR